MKSSRFDIMLRNIIENMGETPVQSVEDSSQVPEAGDAIRTKKTRMEGKVEKLIQDRHGNDEVYFRLADGRLMKTPLDNVIVIEKLEDNKHSVVDDNLNEVTNELLAKYKDAAGKSATDADNRGDYKTGNKRFKGIVKATNKQFDNDKKKAVGEGSMGGINRCAPAYDVSYQDVLDDVIDKWKNTTAIVKETGPFSETLGDNDFATILKKQYDADQAAHPKPKAKTVDIPFNGWTIRYRPDNNGGKIPWIILDRKGEQKHKGESSTDKEAVSAAEDWIKTGGAQGVSHKHANIDFNVDFAKQFAPDGETFYATIDKDGSIPVLIISYEPQEGFKTSHIRSQKHKEVANKLPAITLSARESNSAGLQPNGRYLLGAKDVIDDNTMMFPLIYHSTVQSKGDMFPMKAPGLTVATSRDVS